MGYFSNGEEGMRFEADYCERCANLKIAGWCPILQLHSLWNYDQHGETEIAKAKKQALELFIPRDRDGLNQECKFFIKADSPGNGEIELTPSEAARRLSIGMMRLYNLLQSGKLRAYKRKGRWAIPESAIVEREKFVQRYVSDTFGRELK
jgi:excisionase family DNA binding protein